MIRDQDRQGQPSRGYAFVEFDSHAAALAAHRQYPGAPGLCLAARRRAVVEGSELGAADATPSALAADDGGEQ